MKHYLSPKVKTEIGTFLKKCLPINKDTWPSFLERPNFKNFPGYLLKGTIEETEIGFSNQTLQKVSIIFDEEIHIPNTEEEFNCITLIKQDENESYSFEISKKIDF